MNQVLLEARPYRPFKSSEEYLYAMREDLAEWLNLLYPELAINVDNFMDRLDTGVALCKHANNVRKAAEEYIVRRQARNKSMTRSMTTGLAGPILAMGSIHYLTMAKTGTFFARDNVSNFIAWCRKSLQIFECLLFETDDLIMRKNEKHVILCLLEVARRGAKFGMLAPMLVQMEKQIDREIAADNKAMGISIGCGTENDNNEQNTLSIGTECNDIFESDTDDEDENNDPGMIYGPQPQIITNDLKSLDEMVRDLVEKCTCPSQFPMVRVSEGKYRIGDTKVLIFVRILRSHVMVRVGGGWDTLSHYLDKHDPCRCRAQHRTSTAARLITRTNNNTNGIELHKAQVFYDRSPPSARKQSIGQTVTTTPVINHSNNLTNNLSPPMKPKSRSRSPTPHRKQFINNDIEKDKTNHHQITSSPRLISDFKRKQNSIESNTSSNSNININTQIDNFNLINEIKTSETLLNGEIIKSDNISDNGSEISDEGYRSLGLIQTNNKRTSLHSEASNDDVENNAQLEQASNDSQASASDDQSLKVNELSSSPDTVDCNNLSNNKITKVTFEQSGIFVTDDDISVDIATTTGLRKTGFSVNLYGDETTSPPPPPPQKTINTKIPRSPMPVRRKSVDNTNEHVNGLPTNRKMPVYRSVRKPTVLDSTSNSTKKDGNSTWNGRSTKGRPSLTSTTFQQQQQQQQQTSSSSPSPLAQTNNFNRNSSTRASQILYDTNGRKIKSGSSSLSTSPVKKSTSPLAKQILQVAGTAKNDSQILEKMKELLNKYKYKPKSTQSASQSQSQSQSPPDDYDDFTAAWVNSNGVVGVGISKTTTPTTSSSSPQKDYSKRSSIVSSTDDNSSNSNKDMPVVVSPRKNRRGCSKIPAPIRNAEIY